MGPIQTEINKLIGTVSAAVGAAGRTIKNERQASAKADAEAAKEAAAAEKEAAAEAQAKQEALAQEEADKKEAKAVATEADVRLLGASDIEAKAYRLAQERGLANPKRMIFDKDGKAIATYEEMAQILADNSLSGAVSAQLRGRNAVKNRRMLLEGKTHKERVENAYLAAGGR